MLKVLSLMSFFLIIFIFIGEFSLLWKSKPFMVEQGGGCLSYCVGVSIPGLVPILFEEEEVGGVTHLR